MSDPEIDERFWSHYPAILHPISTPQSTTPGMSGSIVWKVETKSGSVAVRRFSERQQESSLAVAHSLMSRARAFGWGEIPQPLPNNDGQTLTNYDGVFWDICTWQLGDRVELPIDDNRLRSAMHLIARWHSFWTRDKLGSLVVPITLDSIENRRSEWQRLGNSDSCPRLQLGNATQNSDPLALGERTSKIVKSRTGKINEQLSSLTVLLARESKVLCHGDLHREHILFTDGEPSGLIDLSCRWDYAAADLARWLSTTTEANCWPQAVEWYREVAPLSAASERAIPILAETGMVIAALRWEKWLLGSDPERRCFPRPELAYDRWRSLVERLEGGML